MITERITALGAAPLGLLLIACAPQMGATISFGAGVGAEAFTCGTTYTDFGTGGSDFEPRDLRFFVSEIELIDASGGVAPFTPTDDGAFQADGVALLDFEDATAGCAGTPETHADVAGTVVEGQYVGLAFTLGVPAALNHQNAFDAAPPFDVTALFWEWNSGYRFLRVDRAEGSDNNWLFHLGSSGCEAQDDGSRVCEQANRARIELADFDRDASVVTLDLAVLAGATDIDADGGCQSQVGAAECAPLFDALGLAFDGSGGGSQSVFSLR